MLSTPLMLLFMLPSGDVAKVQAQVWDSYSIGKHASFYMSISPETPAQLSLSSGSNRRVGRIKHTHLGSEPISEH